MMLYPTENILRKKKKPELVFFFCLAVDCNAGDISTVMLGIFIKHLKGIRSR